MLMTQQATKQVKIAYYTEVLVNSLLNWFNDNSMKANSGRHYLHFSGNDFSKITIGNKTIS